MAQSIPASAPSVTAPGPFAPIAHSAQLTLDARAEREGVKLRLRASGAAAAAAASIAGVSVSLDGVSGTARPQADGSWFVLLPPAHLARGGRLDVYVLHDGIREVLSGTLPASAAASTSVSDARRGSGSGLLGAHKQLAWWVLNIVIVLIGVIAVSRRMS